MTTKTELTMSHLLQVEETCMQTDQVCNYKTVRTRGRSESIFVYPDRLPRKLTVWVCYVTKTIKVITNTQHYRCHTVEDLNSAVNKILQGGR